MFKHTVSIQFYLALLNAYFYYAILELSYNFIDI